MPSCAVMFLETLTQPSNASYVESVVCKCVGGYGWLGGLVFRNHEFSFRWPQLAMEIGDSPDDSLHLRRDASECLAFPCTLAMG